MYQISKCFQLKHVNACMIDTLISICVEDNLHALWSFYSLVQVPFSIDIISSTNTALYGRNVFTEEMDEQVIRRVTLYADTTAIYPHTHISIRSSISRCWYVRSSTCI